VLWLVGLLTAGPALADLAAQAQPVPSQLPLDQPAPDSFLVVFETTKGRFVMKAHRDWSPLGVDRLYQLAQAHYYDGTVIYRVGPTASFQGGYVVQFGVGNRAAVNQAWDAAGIADEPVLHHTGTGTVNFARGGPRSRTVELGINLTPNSALDTVRYEGVVGFPPIAEVIEGMAVLESLNRQYGNTVFEHWDSVMASGRAYLDRAYPGLDRMLSVAVTTSWGGPTAHRDPGHLTFLVASGVLGEPRTINVYTPPGYDAQPSASFPVLYMPDGGLEEDFPHIAVTIDSLIRLGRIPPMLVVGIENTERRRDLTGPTTVAEDSTVAPRVGGSADFRRFIRDELMPEVRTRYRCTDDAFIVGESLAALFVVETFVLEPSLFQRYIAISPSLWWNGGALLQLAAARLQDPITASRTVYLAAANENGIAGKTAALATLLSAHAATGLRWYYEPRPDLEHSTIFRAVVPEAFVLTLN
jgi:hypothetical protein